MARKIVRNVRKHDPGFEASRTVSGPEPEDDAGRMDAEGQGRRRRYQQPLKPAASYDDHCPTYATICLDQRGKICIKTSPNLEQHRDEVFSPQVRQIFLRFANKPERVAQNVARGSVEPYRDQPDITQECTELSGRRASDTACQIRSQETAAGLCRDRRSSRAQRGGSPVDSSLNLDSDTENQPDEDFGEEQGSSQEYKSIRLDDDKGLENYYARQFMRIQQLMCRAIASHWIRFIEPGKLVRYPYNGCRRRPVKKGRKKQSGHCQDEAEIGATEEPNGESTRPPWWPSQGCRHRTPYHQGRDERVILLVHILRHVHKHKKGITLRDLKAITDKIPLNSQQRIWLDEIYRVREREEGVLNQRYHPEDAVLVKVPVKKPSRKRRKSEYRKTTRKRARASRSYNDVVMSGTPISSPPAASETITAIGTPEVEEQHHDQFSEKDFTNTQANSALGSSEGDPTYSLRDTSLCRYTPGSTTDNGGEEIQNEAQPGSQDAYMETETAIDAHNFEFVPRGPYPAFVMPEAEQMNNRMGTNQSHWTPQPQNMVYNCFPSQSVDQGYPNQPQSIYSPTQTVVQGPFQLSPAINSSVHAPAFHPQQSSHTLPPNPGVPRNFSGPIRMCDSASGFHAISFHQGPGGFPAPQFQPYQMSPDYLDLR